MGGIKPLFSTKAYTSSDKKQSDNSNKVAQTNVCEHTEHVFYTVSNYKEFAEKLTKIEHNKLYEFVSFGNWSLKHVIFHLLKLTGKATVYSTTYGLDPGAARGIVDAIGKGIIQEFNFLYDHKIKQYKEEAHYICANTFPVKITSIHAKVTVIINDKWALAVTGSANWSDSNNKIETTVISTNRKSAEFHRNWIMATINNQHQEPKKIYNEIFTRNT